LKEKRRKGRGATRTPSPRGPEVVATRQGASGERQKGGPMSLSAATAREKPSENLRKVFRSWGNVSGEPAGWKQ